MVAIGIAFLTEKQLGESGLLVGYLIGLFVGGLLFAGLQRINPYLEKLDKYAKTFKSYPYTDKYGIDYPKPTPKDFGITDTEFMAYNKRFQFELIKILFTYGLWLASSIYVLKEKVKAPFGLLIIGGGALLAIVVNYLFDKWNLQISKKHRYYEKINKFQESHRIHCQIMRENSKI